MEHATSATGGSVQREVGKIAAASFVGTALEWYDYFLYGSASALVFDKLFFPSLDPAIGVIAAFTTFAVGFCARPIGAAFFGHFGDRYGRKRTLIATVVLMGVCTGGIGLLPTYQSIGVAAPILLTALRFLQGFSVGGEWSGAMLLTIEHAPVRRRNVFASLVQQGSPVGTLLSSGALALVVLLPDDQLLAWGWRLPFLAAFLLLAVGLYLRLRVEESPLFQRVLAENRQQRVPVATALRTVPLRMLVGIGAPLIVVGGFYLMTTYVISYGHNTLGLSRSLMLDATLVAAGVEMCVLAFFGRLADRITHWRVCAIGSLVSLLVAFPVFALIDTKVPALVIIGVAIGVGALSIPYAPMGPMLSEMFPDETRYSAVALSYNLSGVVSGFVPLIAAAVFRASGQASWSIAGLLALIGLVSLVGALTASLALRRHRYAYVETPAAK
ncbi:MAG: MFS transporter [Streptosporangiales bacterium]